jgi:hypothetical protein
MFHDGSMWANGTGACVTFRDRRSLGNEALSGLAALVTPDEQFVSRLIGLQLPLLWIICA